MNIIDLFSGAGGLTEGFRNKELFNFLCHIEMDKDACSSLLIRNVYYSLKEQNKLNLYYDYLNKKITIKELLEYIPEKEKKDILNLEINESTIPFIFSYIDKKLNKKELDGIIGGPPCQAYSTIGRAANKKKKDNDKRIYLYKYYVSFLERYNPKFFIFENVKGLLSFKDTNGELLLPQIISDFDRHGYSVETKIIDSKDYGVSQKRERLFLVGLRKDIKLDNSFFSLLEKRKELPPSLNELFKDLPKLKAGESSSRYSCENSNHIVRKYIRQLDDEMLTYHMARPHNSNDLAIYKLVCKSKQVGKNLKYTDLPEKFQTHSNKNSFLDRYKSLKADSVCHTVVAHIAKDGHYYIHYDDKQNRSISVREAARIQGFPDNYYFEKSRTAAFRQIGNAVPPILSKKLAETVLELLMLKRSV